MNEIQELKDLRTKKILEKETLQRELAPYADALENYEVMQSLESNLRYEITDKKRELGYLIGTSKHWIERSIVEKPWQIIKV